MANHADLTGAELHEPKGADSANANEVFVSDGAGSGAFDLIGPASLTGLNNKNKIYLRGVIPDLSVAYSLYIPCPQAGVITKVWSSLQAAIVTNNATFNLQIAGVPVTNSTVTITAAGSAAGDVDTAVPTGANSIGADASIEIQNLVTATTASAAEVLIEVDIS